jgi:diguanylate cyclase (GGDEF)-like protein
MTTTNQTPLLQHLVNITGHRDHSQLELAVVSALRQLMDIRRVRKLEFSTHEGETFIRPWLLLENGQVLSKSTPADAEHDEPLSDYLELLQCIEKNANSTQRVTANGVMTLWLPVRLERKVVSCIEITNDAAYSPQTIEVIHGIIEVYRNYQSLLDYSERDALTGLFNRKTFDEQFAQTARNGTLPSERRHAETQWLAVVDIDHFKRVNDHFGHVYGDEVLILVANVLRSSFRASDRIFRFGGEEFVVLLQAAELAQARNVFNRFRQNIEQYNFPQVGNVTVSLGFTGSSQGSSVEILGHADQALYHAKRHGRNLVCFYEDLMASGVLPAASVAQGEVEMF